MMNYDRAMETRRDEVEEAEFLASLENEMERIHKIENAVLDLVADYESDGYLDSEAIEDLGRLIVEGDEIGADVSEGREVYDKVK